MKIQIWKFGTPLQMVGSFLWWLAETHNVKFLGRYAPTISGWMIGAKKKKLSKSA